MFGRTFECEQCHCVFRYGNRKTQESRRNWRRHVLDKHAFACCVTGRWRWLCGCGMGDTEECRSNAEMAAVEHNRVCRIASAEAWFAVDDADDVLDEIVRRGESP